MELEHTLSIVPDYTIGCSCGAEFSSSIVVKHLLESGIGLFPNFSQIEGAAAHIGHSLVTDAEITEMQVEQGWATPAEFEGELIACSCGEEFEGGNYNHRVEKFSKHVTAKVNQNITNVTNTALS